MMCFYHRQRQGLEPYIRKYFRTDFAIKAVSHIEGLKGYGLDALFLYFTPAGGEIKVPDEILAFARERGMIMIHINEEYSRDRYQRERG